MTISSKICLLSRQNQKIYNWRRTYKGEKLVFLTFDDGVNNQITPQVLDTLKV